MTVEEAFWSGSDKDAGKLRTMVTESTMTLEAKGRDAIEIDSYHRFLMCTNNEWTVPATKDERRYFVLDVSDERRGDKGYFDALYKDINDHECIAQFFTFLQNYDISQFNLRKAPATKALQEQIKQSMKPHEKFIESLLEDGQIETKYFNQPIDLETLAGCQLVPKSDLYDAYIKYCEKLSTTGYQRINDKVFGKYVKDVLKPSDTRPNINGTKVTCYSFKPLAELQELFDKYYQYT